MYISVMSVSFTYQITSIYTQTKRNMVYPRVALSGVYLGFETFPKESIHPFYYIFIAGYQWIYNIVNQSAYI